MFQESLGPHLDSTAAEESVLGGILMDNRALDRVADQVSADDFYVPRYRIVFEHMIRLAEAHSAIDPVTLSHLLEETERLADVGGMQALLALAGGALTTVNVEQHAAIIRERAEVRRLRRAALAIAERAAEGDYDAPQTLFDEAQQAIFEIGERQQARSFVPMPVALKEVMGHVRRAFEAKTALTGLPTGFPDLDAKTAGLQPGDLIILAARPSMGKTALALNLAANAAREANKAIAVFSLEMPTAQLVTRILASEARVESSAMRTGFLTDEELHRLVAGARRLAKWPIFIDDSAGISIMELRARVRRLAADRESPDLGLVVIDYLQLMRGSATARSREQAISEISRNLKAIAKELSVPVLALSQLNRGLESRPNKRPIMSDLRESGAIEQDADVIMFIYRDEVYNKETADKGVAEVIIGKQRNGPIGTIRLSFLARYTRFASFQAE